MYSDRGQSLILLLKVVQEDKRGLISCLSSLPTVTTMCILHARERCTLFGHEPCRECSGGHCMNVGVDTTNLIGW